MKKLLKHKETKEPIVTPEAEQDVMALINQLQQQLISLERKIDVLINQSKDKISEERHFERPFQRFDRPQRFDRGRRDDGFRERSYTKAICADCNKECEVPFKPSADRPVYCKECFSRHKEGGSFKGSYDNRPRGGDFNKGRHFDRQQGGESRRFDKKKKPNFRRRK